MRHLAHALVQRLLLGSPGRGRGHATDGHAAQAAPLHEFFGAEACADGVVQQQVDLLVLGKRGHHGLECVECQFRAVTAHEAVLVLTVEIVITVRRGVFGGGFAGHREVAVPAAAEDDGIEFVAHRQAHAAVTALRAQVVLLVDNVGNRRAGAPGRE
ncbi:hypothetical protein D9M68_753830 [compost metagenome]